MGGKGSQTIGYKYYMSLHMGIGRGPLNEIVDIRVGNLSCWKDFGNGPIDISEDGQLVQINAPDLFGGDQKEGGIQGPLYIYNGKRDQVLQPAMGSLPAIETILGGDVPAFRGVTTLWFDGEVCSMNPYPKEWSYRIRRWDAGWFDNDPWYPEKAVIIMSGTNGELVYGMNASHMLWEVNTNPEWGRGMPAELLDENSFIYAANQLCVERFGLCLAWFRRETIKDFIPILINHIGGAQYIDRETGKLTFRLIRDDYDPADLPVFGPDSGLLRIEEDDSSAEETAFNEVSITGFDPVTKQDITLSAHNLASIQSVEEIISNAITFKGLATHDIVARVAAREIKAQSTGQRRFTCYFDRRGWRIKPAMPFKISWPAKGINEMIVRGGEILDEGGELQLKVVQDVFGMPKNTYITPQPPIWTPPNRIPAPVSDAEMFEANYRDFYLRSTESQRSEIDEGDSVIGVVAAPPDGVSTYTYDLATHGPAEVYATRGQSGYTGRTKLVYDCAPLDTTIWLDIDMLGGFLNEWVPGMVAMIGDEQIGVMLVDEETGEATVKRGVADTLPRAHNIDDTVWLVDDDIASDYREYMDGEAVKAKPLPRTTTAVLDIAEATELSVTVDQRIVRPYPPGNLKVDDVSVYDLPDSEDEYPEPLLTWTHRDRILQADQVVGHTEASIGPEPGVTYQIDVYEESGVYLLSSHPLISGTSWTYTTDLQYEDGNPEKVVMEMISVRGGEDPSNPIESYFAYRFEVILDGNYLKSDGEYILSDGHKIKA